jgi:hypothetical protein
VSQHLTRWGIVATVLAMLWVISLTLWSAAQFYLMTLYSGGGTGMAPHGGIPVFAALLLTVVTSILVSVFRPLLHARALATASKVTATAVSVPSAVIAVLSWSFVESSRQAFAATVMIGAGALAAWAIAFAISVCASLRPRVAVPIATAIGLSPLVLIWFRLVL